MMYWSFVNSKNNSIKIQLYYEKVKLFMSHAFKHVLHDKLYRRKGKHWSSTHSIQGVFESYGQDFNRYG